MHPDDYARSKEVFKNLMTTKGNGGIIEAKYKHKNGHYLTVESQGNNQLHNPAINAVVLTTRDTTKRKEKEEEKLQLVYELMEKNADLKQFSYITSHNLRAPLTNLMAICTLLDTENISQEDTHELINAFKTSTIKLNDTLNDLIKILIIKDGRSQEIETVYFHKTLNEVKASIAGMIEASRAVIHADFSAAASVNFYSIYMESILLNLLTNSLKYAYPGRKPVIAMQTRVEEKFVVFTFMDNGMGMNMQKVRSKIFGLYQRFHTNIEGKGIGLYLVQSQVTALGGSITVDSKEGEGTTFVIWFKKELFGKR
jgi:signal transduction histidine kinase